VRVRSRRQQIVGTWKLRREPGAVQGNKDRTSFALQVDARVGGRGAAKLAMDRDRSRLVHDGVTAGPETNAVVGVLVVRRPVAFIEATELLEDRTAVEQ